MTQDQVIGLVGGLVGAVIGVLGGALGTFLSIRNARTPAEKRLLLGHAAGIWAAVVGLLGVPIALAWLRVIPSWGVFVGGLLFAALAFGTIPRVNRKAEALGRADSTRTRT